MDATVKSARRVLEILQYFAEHQEAATAKDVEVALGYPQSSTSSLMRSLATLGYLAFEPSTRRFKPTIRVALLGDWIVDEAGQDASPPALMRRLRNATGDTTVLGSQQGLQVVYVHVLQATNPIRFHMRPGAHRPLCLTAVGRALLSLKPDSEISAIVRRLNAEREHGAAALDLSEILAAVRKGREAGYFCTRGTATPGAGVLAMPLGGLRDHPPLAIGIGSPIDRIERDLDALVAILRTEIGRVRAVASTCRSQP